MPRLVRSTEVPTWFVTWTSTAFTPAGGFTAPASERSTRLVWAADTPVDGVRQLRLWTAVAAH